METEERLSEAITQLASARDLSKVTEVVRHYARELTGADGVTFVLRQGDHCFYADENAIAPLWKGKRFPLQTCISGWVMSNRRAVVIEDVFQDARIPVAYYKPTFVKSMAMVPVRYTDPIAAIGAYWGRPHVANDRELGILTVLADASALALAGSPSSR